MTDMRRIFPENMLTRQLKSINEAVVIFRKMTDSEETAHETVASLVFHSDLGIPTFYLAPRW